MANPMKVVNNVYIEMTDEEVAQGDAAAEAADLDLSQIRQQRNGNLDRTDRTQIADFPLGSDSLADVPGGAP
jgi:hypothetical protein